jgi:membrane associated rhomboid family serine protease
VFFLGVWFVLQVFSGLGSVGADAAPGGTAFWSHVAGFVFGAAAGALYRARGTRYWEAPHA